jgi:hypothetical protein
VTHHDRAVLHRKRTLRGEKGLFSASEAIFSWPYSKTTKYYLEVKFMSYKSVMQFLESSSKDESMRAALANLMGVGDGDISSAAELDGEEAQALLGERGVRVAAFAEEKGFEFTLGELNAVVSVFQRYNSGELSKEDFAKAMGWDLTAESISSVGKTVGLVYRGVKHDTQKDKSSATQVLDFMKRTSEDEEIRDELKEILAVGDGDIGDFTEVDAEEASALKSGRGVLVAELAAKHGYIFSLSDLPSSVSRQVSWTPRSLRGFSALTLIQLNFFPSYPTLYL